MSYYPKLLCFFIICTAFHPDVQSQDIPFKMVRNLIIVEATIGGVPGNYILDTGTSGIILNTRFFKGTPTGTIYYGVTGEAEPVSFLFVSVALGPHFWKKVYADIIPMKMLEDSRGIPIHGLIGARIFRKHTLCIDFLRRKMRLIETEKGIPAPGIDHTGYTEAIPFLAKHHTPVVSLDFENGARLRVTIDSGAEINLISDEYYHILPAYLPDSLETMVGGIGPGKNMAIHLMSGASINNLKLQAMRTAFTDLREYNRVASWPPVDGIVGTELLQQFKVAIDFRNRRLYLEPLGDMASVDTRK